MNNQNTVGQVAQQQAQPVQQFTQQTNYQTQGQSMNNTTSLLKTNWKKILIPAIVLLSAYFLYRMLFGGATITVIGEGTHDFEADQVSMIVTYVNSNVDPDKAIKGGQLGVNSLIDTVKSIVDDVEIQQAFYQMDPVSANQGLTYQVVNAFSLKTSQVDQVDSLVRTLYAEGASSISNVNFSHTKQEEMAQKAREAAVKDAKQEAKRIAGSAGKHLGKIVTIADDQRKATSSVGSEAGGASFKNVSVTKQVSIVYRIW